MSAGYDTRRYRKHPALAAPYKGSLRSYQRQYVASLGLYQDEGTGLWLSARQFRAITGLFPEGIGAGVSLDLRPGAVNRVDTMLVMLSQSPLGGLIMVPRVVLPIKGCGNGPV